MPTAPNIFELIYVSAAAHALSSQDLGMLLIQARANNQQLGVTGLLIHHQGSFFQVLEGERTVVDSLYDRISRDKRHTRVIILSRTDVPSRAFGEWSMGFADGSKDAVRQLPGFNDFLRRGFELLKPVESASRARQLAMAFRDGRFRQHVESR